MDIVTEYRKARAQGSAPPHAIRHARYAVRMAGMEFPRWPGDDVTLDLPRGESIAMRLEHDDHGRDIVDEFGAAIDWSPGRWPRDYGAPDWWQDRDGVVYALGDGYRDRMAIDFDGGGTLADSRAYFSGRGMARHDAWLAARRQRDGLADAFRNAGQDGYVGYTVTLLDANGAELQDESCWGFSGSDDYAGREAADTALSMAEQRADYWTAETARARDAMRAARVAFSALAREYRHAQAVGPAMCDAIRARLDLLRGEHRAALATVAGGGA